MHEDDRKVLKQDIRNILIGAVSDDYVGYIICCENNGKTFVDDVVNDVMESAVWQYEKYYTEDDIRLGIGRVLMNRLNCCC